MILEFFKVFTVSEGQVFGNYGSPWLLSGQMANSLFNFLVPLKKKMYFTIKNLRYINFLCNERRSAVGGKCCSCI